MPVPSRRTQNQILTRYVKGFEISQFVTDNPWLCLAYFCYQVFRNKQREHDLDVVFTALQGNYGLGHCFLDFSHHGGCVWHQDK